MISEKVFEQFPVLKTTRLLLREFRENDTEFIFKQFTDEKVLEFMSFAPMTNIEEAIEFLGGVFSSFEEKKEIFWAIENSFTGETVGSISLENIRENVFSSEIGFDLATQFQGKGYMKEAIEAVVKFGLFELGLNRIEAYTNSKNEKSVNVLKHGNFKQEGTLRDFTYFDNQFHDVLVFSVLKSDLSS